MLNPNALIIAEAKPASPFGYRSRHEFWDGDFEIACAVGDMVSVHTSLEFEGSFELIARARRMRPDMPILAKGKHKHDDDIKRALGNGASRVLVVGRVPGDDVDIDKCFIEPDDLAQLREFGLPEDAHVVWNQRDLTTGRAKPEAFEQARTVWPGWLCDASFKRTAADVHPLADAVLVGEHAEEFGRSIGRL